MAESETEITREELQKEITAILENASLENTSTKKVIQKLESKLGLDLSEKKKLIDQLVMDYVNNMDSDDEDVSDDSNDSDWGYRHDGHLLDGHSDDGYHAQPQVSTVTTSGMRHLAHQDRQAVGVVLKRVDHKCGEEDESDIFGKLTAKKLRKLSEEQRDFMMIQINQLFYNNCHRRRGQPKRRMADYATSTATAVQRGAKKIYRLEKTNLPAEGPLAVAIANLRKTIASTYKARSDISSGNVPDPYQQPIVIPMDMTADEIAAVNNADNGMNVVSRI